PAAGNTLAQLDAASLRAALRHDGSTNVVRLPLPGKACSLKGRAGGGMFVGSSCAVLAIAGSRVVDGASGSFRLLGERGSLDLFVSSTSTARWRYIAQEVGPCDSGGFDVSCPTLWQARGQLPADKVAVDPLLRTASTTFVLHHKRVHVVWKG